MDDSGLLELLNNLVSFACYDVSEESTASIFRVTYLATTQFKNQKTTITWITVIKNWKLILSGIIALISDFLLMH
jgi:hypothetical protein